MSRYSQTSFTAPSEGPQAALSRLPAASKIAPEERSAKVKARAAGGRVACDGLETPRRGGPILMSQLATTDELILIRRPEAVIYPKGAMFASRPARNDEKEQ